MTSNRRRPQLPSPRSATSRLSAAAGRLLRPGRKPPLPPDKPPSPHGPPSPPHLLCRLASPLPWIRPAGLRLHLGRREPPRIGCGPPRSAMSQASAAAAAPSHRGLVPASLHFGQAAAVVSTPGVHSRRCAHLRATLVLLRFGQAAACPTSTSAPPPHLARGPAGLRLACSKPPSSRRGPPPPHLRRQSRLRRRPVLQPRPLLQSPLPSCRAASRRLRVVAPTVRSPRFGSPGASSSRGRCQPPFLLPRLASTSPPRPLTLLGARPPPRCHYGPCREPPLRAPPAPPRRATRLTRGFFNR